MPKKKISQKAQKLYEYYSRFPDWYWKYGLHDAQILSISELELPTDWKSEHPKRNCLEIILDSHNALYERDIKKICLYNYKLIVSDDYKSWDKPWWIGDILTELPNGRYRLEIEIETSNGKRKTFTVEFELPEVIRNK